MEVRIDLLGGLAGQVRGWLFALPVGDGGDFEHGRDLGPYPCKLARLVERVHKLPKCRIHCLQRMTAQPTEPAMPEPTDQPSSPKPAHVYASQRDWPAYFEVMAGKPPRETLTAALDAFEAEGMPPRWHGSPNRESEPNTHGSESRATPPLAIDLGCGEGRDTAELLRRGWRVLAIDGHPDAIRRLGERDDLVPADRVEIRYEPFEGLVLPRAKLINASFSLPFCPPEHFEALWAVICEAIEPGGRFAGQFFGDRDDWAPIPDRSHQTRAEAEALLAGFEVELFEEIEDDGKDALENPKHWHRFDVVARMPGRKGSS